MGKLARYAANSGGVCRAPDPTAAPHEQRVFWSVRIREGHLIADSGRWRSPFRTDADHDYELMSIIVPR
jgi:hypothetical protein